MVDLQKLGQNRKGVSSRAQRFLRVMKKRETYERCCRACLFLNFYQLRKQHQRELAVVWPNKKLQMPFSSQFILMSYGPFRSPYQKQAMRQMWKWGKSLESKDIRNKRKVKLSKLVQIFLLQNIAGNIDMMINATLGRQLSNDGNSTKISVN